MIQITQHQIKLIPPQVKIKLTPHRQPTILKVQTTQPTNQNLLQYLLTISLIKRTMAIQVHPKQTIQKYKKMNKIKQ